jgi:hypothetical protein
MEAKNSMAENLFISGRFSLFEKFSIKNGILGCSIKKC